ncbi:hypothetical protein EsDP_00003201 [Epichloe bromicola]|uniref:Uncharacterized protein n=1 Tax=Epichloe bromicola TaxID=79588 RepID=A0ABQ0CN44_9HYPO
MDAPSSIPNANKFAQELLSTFPSSLGEVSLQPSTGGTFTVSVHAASSAPQTLWDRKLDGGFPETKELKRRLRDVVEPRRDLGHVDRGAAGRSAGRPDGCEDCATGQEGEGEGDG